MIISTRVQRNPHDWVKSRGWELNPEVVNCGKASYEGSAAVLLMKALGYKAVLYIKGLNYTLKVVSLTTTKRYMSMILLEQSIRQWNDKNKGLPLSLIVEEYLEDK